LDASAGRGGWVEAATAYERALREAADFADAGRGWFQLGEARLALGFGPEAGAAFREVARRDGALRVDARVGEAAALRVRGRARPLGASPALALEARMRAALLDASEHPDAAARALATLAAEPAPRALRAAILGEAAEAAARAGRFEDALGLLDRAAGLGRDG